MKVKDGPVHDINTGRPVGYTDIEINKDNFLNVVLLVTAMYTWAAAATAINGLNQQPKTDIGFNRAVKIRIPMLLTSSDRTDYGMYLNGKQAQNN